MDLDGIPVDLYSREKRDGIDIQTVGMELAHALAEMGKAVERLDLGRRLNSPCEPKNWLFWCTC